MGEYLFGFGRPQRGTEEDELLGAVGAVHHPPHISDLVLQVVEIPRPHVLVVKRDSQRPHEVVESSVLHVVGLIRGSVAVLQVEKRHGEALPNWKSVDQFYLCPQSRLLPQEHYVVDTMGVQELEVSEEDPVDSPLAFVNFGLTMLLLQHSRIRARPRLAPSQEILLALRLILDQSINFVLSLLFEGDRTVADELLRTFALLFALGRDPSRRHAGAVGLVALLMCILEELGDLLETAHHLGAVGEGAVRVADHGKDVVEAVLECQFDDADQSVVGQHVDFRF